MKKLNIYKQIFLLGILCFIAIGGNCQTIISRTVNLEYPEVEFQLFSDGIQILENDFIYIDAVPEMPNMLAQVTTTSSQNINIEIKLTINYIKYCFDDPDGSINENCRSNPVRILTDNYPGTGYANIEVNNQWSINNAMNNDFRGGEAIVYWKIAGTTVENEFKFYIRGLNPSETVVKDYLDVVSGCGCWFLHKLVRTETSQLNQFNFGDPGTEFTNSNACPNWGPPDGWGIMQLDPPVITDILWNWKTNVAHGWDWLNGEKKNIATSKWNYYNGLYDVAINIDPSLINSGITHYPTGNGNVIFDLTPTGDEKSFFDGIWIKNYNGSSGGHIKPGVFDEEGEPVHYAGYYYIWQNEGDDVDNPHWAVQNSNSNDRDYVNEVCSQND
jgi:hypothetical protein